MTPVFKRTMLSLANTLAARLLGARFLSPLDRNLARLTGGRLIVGRLAAPVLLLTTTGRKSGKPFTTPVTYLEDGGNFVVIASNWGQRRHPGWSANLLANPHATVQIDRHRQNVIARPVTPREREELWPRLLAVWPAFQTYADTSGRDLRVFVLEPEWCDR